MRAEQLPEVRLGQVHSLVTVQVGQELRDISDIMTLSCVVRPASEAGSDQGAPLLLLHGPPPGGQLGTRGTRDNPCPGNAHCCSLSNNPKEKALSTLHNFNCHCSQRAFIS